jgi:hypothetical protein
MDRSSPNFFVGSSIKVILSRLAFLADCEWLSIFTAHENVPSDYCFS